MDQEVQGRKNMKLQYVLGDINSGNGVFFPSKRLEVKEGINS
jgi:hypothetical protein